MTDEERPLVMVTARLLRAAQRIDWMTTPLTIVAAASIIVHRGGREFAAVAIVAGVAAKVYAIRVALDARLFDDVLTSRLSTAELDAALAPLRTPAPRPWPDRCQGARRLVWKLATCAVIQAAAVVALALA
jgi:hypothetical protein